MTFEASFRPSLLPFPRSPANEAAFRNVSPKRTEKSVMAMVEQSKKDTMNAADFAEEFKTTPGRTPRIPETPEMPWTRPTRNADFFLESFFSSSFSFVVVGIPPRPLLETFFSSSFSPLSSFSTPTTSLFPPPPPPPAKRRSRLALLWCTCGSLLKCISSCSFEPDATTFVLAVGSISKIISSPKCAISSPSPSASESLTCSLSAFSRARNFLAPLAAANAMAIIVNPTILSPTSPIAFMFNSFFSAKNTQTSRDNPNEWPNAHETPRRKLSLRCRLFLLLAAKSSFGSLNRFFVSLVVFAIIT